MDFVSALLLPFLWFVRPQDIFAFISGVSLVKYVMYGGLFTTFRREGGISLAAVLAVPVDWIIAAYCLWAIYATSDHTNAAKEVFTYFSFHMVTALALTTWRRMEIYLNVWLGCLGVLALLAVSTHWGFELVEGSAQLTTVFHERLTLNTWIFRNPNSLGHGVIAILTAGLSWFLLSGGKNRFLGLFMIAVAANCVYLTESKGAFLAGAGGLLLTLLFKRRIWLQIGVLALAYLGGFAVLKSLPRMDSMSKSDEGIQGRMIVWQQAKHSMESSQTGLGLKQFQGYVTVRDARLHRTIHLTIATHGSYVRHGADLGYVGLMLYAGVFYCGARMLNQGRTPVDSEVRRIQRTIYGLLVTTALSSFVVDRAYHMDYFLLSGLLSAFHRKFIPPRKTLDELEAEEQVAPMPRNVVPSLSAAAEPAVAYVAFNAAGAPKSADEASAASGAEPSANSITEMTSPGGGKPVFPSAHRRAADEEAEPDGPPLADEKDEDPDNSLRLPWVKLGIFDFVAMFGLLWGIIYCWDLFSTDFIVF